MGVENIDLFHQESVSQRIVDDAWDQVRFFLKKRSGVCPAAGYDAKRKEKAHV